MGQGTKYGVMEEGFKAELEELKGWIMRSFGKYSPKELMERMTFDIMMSPPGYTRAQATFGLDVMCEIFENMCNKCKENEDITNYVVDEEEYGGTYDRPWNLLKYRLENDRGETVQQGRDLFTFRRIGGVMRISAIVWKIVSPQEDFNILDYMPEWFIL